MSAAGKPPTFSCHCDHCGHAEQQNEQHMIRWPYITFCPSKVLYTCSTEPQNGPGFVYQLAYLSVLKLSSELHGGGTGSAETLGRLHTALR